jgi:hypothetical protein
MPDINIISPKWAENVQDASNGVLPAGDNSSIDTFLVAWNNFKNLLNKSVTAGSIFSNPISNTYTLPYTASLAYNGGALSSNGEIHCAPFLANRGMKISANGVPLTYSLVYTNANGAYSGAVLSANGDVHFVPSAAGAVGQKVNANGVVSTYSLVYTGGGYGGGVLSSSNEVHFMPQNAPIGQKISSAGVVSTYSLVYTTSAMNAGGALAPNGDIILE